MVGRGLKIIYRIKKKSKIFIKYKQKNEFIFESNNCGKTTDFYLSQKNVDKNNEIFTSFDIHEHYNGEKIHTVPIFKI